MILRTLVDPVAAAIERGMSHEPVATAVALGLIAGAATSSFSGFVVGVVAAAIIARTMRRGPEPREELPGDQRYGRQTVRESA